MDAHIDHTPVSAGGQGGKACTNCARVKCKCIVRADGYGCERCHRLSKPCVPSSPARKRGPKRNTRSRSARLEKKLDDLVSFLQSGKALSGSSAAAKDTLVPEDDEVQDDADTSPTLTENTRVGPPSANPNNVYADEPNPEEAESCLHTFREEMMPILPYIYIEPDQSAAELRQRYPFLWLNIMSVSSQSPKIRNSLAGQARRVIVEKIVSDGVRSVDMLLGVLTYLCWVHLFPMDKYFASITSQIVVSLIFDLGLQAPPPEHPHKVGQHIKAIGFGPCQVIRKERTDEDRRAVLGAFVITSTTSHSFRSADGLRWSPYFDECLNYLARTSTVPQDQDLIAQVRTQLMVNQVRYSHSSTSGVEVPIAYVDALQVQLDKILSSGNGSGNASQENPSMLRLYHFAVLMIHEPILLKSPSSSNDPDLERFHVYQRCTDSIKCWLEMFFSIPRDHLPYLPCSNYCQLYYAMGFLYRISTLKVPGWDPATSKKMVDLMPTLDKVIDNFERAKEEAALRSPESGTHEIFWFGIQKLLALKTVWQCEMAHQPPGGEDGPPLLAEATAMSAAEGHSPLFSMDPTLLPMDSALFPMMPSFFDDLSWQ